MANKRIVLSVDTKEVDRVSIGKMLYDAFDYSNPDNIYGEKDEEGKLTVKEIDIQRIADLVNRESPFKDFTKIRVIQ